MVAACYLAALKSLTDWLIDWLLLFSASASDAPKCRIGPAGRMENCTMYIVYWLYGPMLLPQLIDRTLVTYCSTDRQPMAKSSVRPHPCLLSQLRHRDAQCCQTTPTVLLWRSISMIIICCLWKIVNALHYLTVGLTACGSIRLSSRSIWRCRLEKVNLTTLCPRKNYNPRQCRIEMSNLNAS